MTKTKTKTKNYLGYDYRCSKCDVTGMRLWRNTHTMLDNVELFCAACAEIDQAKQIARYAEYDDPFGISCTIGDLVPARPTPEGDTFWGHSSGDCSWWYALPQYERTDKRPIGLARELDLIRRERDHFQQASEHYATDWLKEMKMRSQAERDRDDALRAAKLLEMPK